MVEWVAYNVAPSDPKLSILLHRIEASPPSLTVELENDIAEYVRVSGNVNQMDSSGSTLLHAAR